MKLRTRIRAGQSSGDVVVTTSNPLFVADGNSGVNPTR